jgi:hypothetical protein
LGVLNKTSTFYVSKDTAGWGVTDEELENKTPFACNPAHADDRRRADGGRSGKV